MRSSTWWFRVAASTVLSVPARVVVGFRTTLRRRVGFIIPSRCSMRLSSPLAESTSNSDRRVEEYLRETLEAVDPSYRMRVTEQHRKTMMRSLLGWTKLEFDAALRELQTRRLWEATDSFITSHWGELQGLSVAEDAIQFQSGLQQYRTFRDRPLKLFTFLARGRSYQGKFDRLLRDTKPEWIPLYEDIGREPDRRELLKWFAQEQHVEPLQTHLLTCAEQPLPKAAPQAKDGGKSSGLQSEINLVAYLERLINDSEAVVDQSTELRILAPVYLKNHRKGRTPNKKCPYTIEFPVHVDLAGKTTELDAMIVELLPDSGQARIHQVWEAKATLNPVTIGDALSKKGQAVQAIVHPDTNATLVINDQYFAIVNGYSKERRGEFDQMPKLGLFGKTLSPPSAAARRIQTVLAEARLESMADVVINEALWEGSVMVHLDQVAGEVERLVELACELRPVMVISSDLGNQEARD